MFFSWTYVKLITEWHIVFYTTSSIALFGAIFYAIFGSGERQPWAMVKKEGKINIII